MASLRGVLRNPVKEKLARDEIVVSMTVRLVRSIEIAQIAQSAGFDCFYIDIEHCSFSLDTTSQICMAGLAAGITPMVRVPNGSPEYVVRVLEGGALGVIVPHVRSADEARRVVAAARFAPSGERSMAGGMPHLKYRSFPRAEAMQALNEATMVVVMMETPEALDQVEEIAAVDGIDLLLVGTNDLTTEMGISGLFDDPRVHDAYSRTIAACRKHGKHVGVGGLPSRPDLIAKYVEMGARFVSTGTDLTFMIGACERTARQVRELEIQNDPTDRARGRRPKAG
jgi:2-keto-3-deoxy-L-rhamnonate aldolase RhmA